MALREYKCGYCSAEYYVFDNEYGRLYLQKCSKSPFANHSFSQMPPRISTVIATNMFMLEEPQLDSLPTIYELDRQLNIEAREAKETELFQDIRRNL